MKTVEVRYGITFGKGDSSDWINYDLTLTDEEAALYDEAVESGTTLCDVPELAEALQRAYEEIEDMEIEQGLDMEEPYVMECQGTAPMDEDELNDLVADRDPHALAFFGLDEASDEEIDEWDAYDLDEVPTIAEFKEDFAPYSPFDEGWILTVQYLEDAEFIG